MRSEKLHDLVIVGGGPGGLAAAIYAMRAALDTVLVEKGAAGGQVNNSVEVENYPGFTKISGAELAEQFSTHVASLNTEVLRREVMQVEPGLDCHQVHLDNDETLCCRAIILATGGNPKKLGIPGEDKFYGRGVSYCAVCDGFFYRGKTVVVVGGGDSAAEEALYLAKIAKKVYMVHRRDTLRAGMILQKRIKAEPMIEMIWNTVPVEVKADDTGVTGLVVQQVESGEQREVATDGVFIFVGFSPNNDLVPAGTKSDPAGYVVTDEKCQTSIAGIYAVGDLRQKYARQIVTAAADGCVAALAAARYVEEGKNVGQRAVRKDGEKTVRKVKSPGPKT